LPYWRLEDGFLRSASVRSKGPPLSLVLDDVGIYYDATGPSRLETWLATPGPVADESELGRASECRVRLVNENLCKYNHAFGALPSWLSNAKHPVVLVVDQTRGDASVSLGNASEESFQRMLDAALAEHPEATVVVKTHPDVVTDGKRGHFAKVGQRARLLTESVDPAVLLGAVDRVYVVTSGLGFEALLRGVPVSCFGTPFYAGWGLTDDRVAVARRGVNRSLDELTQCALIRYARYVDPVTGKRCELESCIDHLALQRKMFTANRGTHFCFGFSAWKWHYVRRYLESPEGRVVFVSRATQAKRKGIGADSKIVVWGNRESSDVRALAEEHGLPIQRMEDGFLRSVGLGADFTAPASLALDTRGVYYDPSKPSDLEHLLQTSRFSEMELEAARRLIARIVELRISKYNFRASRAEWNLPPGRRILLVPGQVEDDASVLRGSPQVRSNLALLREVRHLNPDAYIIYKVHPDVVSGHRVGGEPSAELYDQLVDTASIDACLEVAHEVHTMTSLVGFEALLRGLKVVCYGQPFYSGWGLTEDRVPLERRTRRLTLNELAAGVLLRYPRYYSFRARAFTSADRVVDSLSEARARAKQRQPGFQNWASRQLRRGITLLKGVIDAP